MAALAAELDAAGHLECDFADPATPAPCLAAAAAALGHVDVLVANHAMSCDQDLEALEAAAIDATLAINVRATLLLVQAYAAAHDDARPGGRVILFTSGQHLEPMARELPYAASKGALHGITASLAAHLAPRRILVNALNPGPTDTGWATPALTRHELRRLPLGRWGSPEDAARLVGWLATDDAGWVTGQVLDERRWVLAQPRLSDPGSSRTAHRGRRGGGQGLPRMRRFGALRVDVDSRREVATRPACRAVGSVRCELTSIAEREVATHSRRCPPAAEFAEPRPASAFPFPSMRCSPSPARAL